MLGILISIGIAIYTFTFGWQTYSTGNKLGAVGIFIISATCIAVPVYMLTMH